MATDYDLNTVSREDAGTSHSRRMRRDGMVPAVVYGAGKDSVKVSINQNELLKKLNNEAFLNSILNISSICFLKFFQFFLSCNYFRHICY